MENRGLPANFKKCGLSPALLLNSKQIKLLIFHFLKFSTKAKSSLRFIKASTKKDRFCFGFLIFIVFHILKISGDGIIRSKKCPFGGCGLLRLVTKCVFAYIAAYIIKITGMFIFPAIQNIL